MSTDESRPEARAGMLIRKPVETVFRAFVDPATTSRFWFTDGSGVLEQGDDGHLDVGNVWRFGSGVRH